MTAMTLQSTLRSWWPVVVLGAVLLVAAALDGVWAGAAAALLAALAVGPLLLIQRALERRRNPPALPPDRTDSIHELLGWDFAVAAALAIAAFANIASDWLGGTGPTVILLLLAVLSISYGAQRIARRSTASGAVVSVARGIAVWGAVAVAILATAAAVGNVMSGWLGGAVWTAIAGVLAAISCAVSAARFRET
jgi:hypothetical protein